MTDQFVPDGEAVGEGVEYPAPSAATTDPQPERLQELLAERTADLQRLQAEYVNYKRRVDRDRHVARSRGIEAVVVDLLPVLDSIEAARAHDELNEGAGLIADQIEKVSTKHGLVRYGAVGDPFDPMLHEALMHVQVPGYSVQTCSQVIQPGYRLGDRIVRAARVAVADPTESPDAVPDDVSSLTSPGQS